MGIKRYILLTVVYMLAVGLYVYSFNGDMHTVDGYNFALELPIAVWIILPAMLLFIASVAHMGFYKLKIFWKDRTANKDFENFKLALGSKVLGETSHIRYKSEWFKFIGKNASLFEYKDIPSIVITDEKIEENRQLVRDIDSGKVMDLKKYKLSEDNELIMKNEFNKLNEDPKYAATILKNSKDENSALCQKAYFEYLKYASYDEIKKIGYSPSKEMFRVLMERYLEEEGTVAIKLDLATMQDLLMQFKANREDYLELAYEIKTKLDPDSLIALFEKLYNTDDYSAVSDAYLYVLYELQMIDKIREILDNSDADEFMKWKTILFLRDNGKNVDSGLFLRI